jgi:hypothetical protein
MAYRAIVFDLFGTLVRNFSVQEYDRVLMRMAETLSTPYTEFRQHAGKSERASSTFLPSQKACARQKFRHF